MEIALHRVLTNFGLYHMERLDFLFLQRFVNVLCV